MALLSTQAVTNAGTTPAFSAASAGGDTFVPSDTSFLIVRTGSTPLTVTITSPTLCSQGFEHDLAVSVLANSEKWIGPLKTARYANTAGVVAVSYSAVTNVTVAAVST